VKALVTGSSGFIGSHLTQALVKEGYQVFCLIRKNSDLKWTKDLDVSFIRGDFLNKNSLKKCVQGMDYVFHLAAVLNAGNWNTYYNANVRATQNLVQSCSEENPEIKKFVFVSSISASGPTYDKIFRDESCVCSPSSLYGKSKLLAEKAVFGFKDKIPVTIARPPNVIGPRQNELFIILKLLKKHIFPVIGKNDEQTSICFVHDLVRALILMAKKEKACSQTYYVTDPKPYSWRNMLKIIAQKMGVSPYLIKIPYPVLLSAAQFSEILAKITGNDPFITTQYIFSTRNHYHLYDSKKIQNELDFKYKTEFSKGIEDIIQWYKKRNLL
jgi:nucleoside-diphosphate-sugar epimerase